MAITKATAADIQQLKELVNLSYRGEASKQGWTTEADLFEGDRINEANLKKMMNAPSAVVYKYEEDEKSWAVFTCGKMIVHSTWGCLLYHLSSNQKELANS
jgi:hypothetical protein